MELFRPYSSDDLRSCICRPTTRVVWRLKNKMVAMSLYFHIIIQIIYYYMRLIIYAKNKFYTKCTIEELVFVDEL